MVELIQIKCRDTDVKVSDFVQRYSHLFITMGSSTLQDWPAPEYLGSTQNFEPIANDCVLNQELSQPNEQPVEFDWQWQTPHSDMNGNLNYIRAQAFGLGLNFVSTDYSETGQPSNLFSHSQYDAINVGDRDTGVESSSSERSTIQEVLESGTAIQPIAKYDLGRKPLVEQANRNEKTGPQSSVPSRFEVPRKRRFVDFSSRQAKRTRRIERPGSNKDSPVATHHVGSSSPDARPTKRTGPSVSLLSVSILKHLVHGPGDHKIRHLLSQVLQPAKTLEKKQSLNLVSKVSQTSHDTTSGNLRRRRSNSWSKPTSDAVGGVAEAFSQLSMTV